MTVAADGGTATDGADGDLTGATFAGLEVGAAVGRDLVSTVYRADEREPDDGSGQARAVALRVVRADLCAGQDDERRLYRRFQRHAAHALTFEHPNAPTTHEVGEHAGLGYLVSTELDAVSFGTYLERSGPLDIAVALPLFEQIADVLDAGHRAGLAHGAVSPSTLQLVGGAVDTERATVQLTGHGISALLELRIQRDRKHLDVVDELLYVAPEQLRQQPLTGRTDQYAMACALVHALTGAPPFVRDSVGGLFGAHLFVSPRFDGHVAAQAVRKALSKEPRERYATCGQLIADIERAQRSSANRRRAALRRRRDAPRSVAGVANTDSADPATRLGSDVEDEHHRAGAASGHNGAGSVQEESSTPAADTQARGAGNDDQQSEPTDDKSSTARHRTAAMSYSANARGTTNGPVAEDSKDDNDDAPLLSDVLSHRQATPQRTTWQPPGVWLALTIVFLVAAAATVWLIGT